MTERRFLSSHVIDTCYSAVHCPIMRAILCLCLVLWACEAGPLGSTRCSDPCYSGPHNTAGVGACAAGRPVCEDGVFQRCDGEVLPTREQCDGVDNDCDGVVDDNTLEAGQACGPALGECARHRGMTVCRSGLIECTGAAQPMPETCDGLDNDCNGIADDIIPTFCPVSNFQTYITPPCSPGVQVCVNGENRCYGQHGPETEVCRDGIDNDCNGLIDDADPGLVDVAVIIDISCSMGDAANLDGTGPSKLEAVKTALWRAGTDPALLSRDIRFWLYALPGPTPGVQYAEPDAACQGCTLSELAPATVNLAISGNGLEPSYDILYDLISGRAPLPWRSGSDRVMLLFTDEKGQTSGLQHTAWDVVTARQQSGRQDWITVVTDTGDSTIRESFVPFADIMLDIYTELDDVALALRSTPPTMCVDAH